MEILQQPSVGKLVLQYLRNPKVHKFIALKEMHPRILRELADRVAKPLSIISEKLWQSNVVHTDWKRGNNAKTQGSAGLSVSPL